MVGKTPPYWLIATLSGAILLGMVSYFYLQIQKIKALEAAQQHQVVKSMPLITLQPPTQDKVLSDLFGVSSNTLRQVNNPPDQRSRVWHNYVFMHENTPFLATLVITQTIDPETKAIANTHSDNVKLNIVVYKQIDNRFEVFAKQINVGQLGNWGEPPLIKEMKMLSFSKHENVLLIDDVTTGQGYTEEGKALFSFDFKDKHWQDLGFIQTAGDNAGACDDSTPTTSEEDLVDICWSFTGEITLANNRSHSEYPDLFVIHRGTTIDNNNKIIPKRNQSYVFNGKEYVKS